MTQLFVLGTSRYRPLPKEKTMTSHQEKKNMSINQRVFHPFDLKKNMTL